MSDKKSEICSKVIGVVGQNGSGKDTLIKYLDERCGLEVLSLGDVARELAHLEEAAFSRDKLHEVSQKYQEKYGEDFFIKAVIEEIESKLWEKVGVTGIRTPSEVDTLRKHFGSNFFLIHVYVDNPEVRFERLKQRGESRDPQNYDDFLAQEKAEKDMFRVDEAKQCADISIANAGTLEDFHWEIDQLILQEQFFQSLCREA
ncbi:MAG: AAA family ATPase [Desulfobacca sp.]|nr:AAA family ATPase [Desulfobacca sp.]